MNVKVLLISCASCVIILVGPCVFFMTPTVLLSERGIENDDRKGIKPTSLSHLVSEEL